MPEIKTRPSDGMPQEEEENNDISEAEELGEFEKQAAEERERREEEMRKRAEELRKARESKRNQDEEELDIERKEALKIDLKKVYVMKKGVGVFDRKGFNKNYGTEKFEKQVEKNFKTGAKRVSLEKKQEFMQLFNKYHSFKRNNLSTVDKDEFIKFEAGMRRGTSDQKFNEFCQHLKKEGIIKDSGDVKKLFTRRDLKTMRNSLTGQKDDIRPARAERRTPGQSIGGPSSTRPLGPTLRK